MKRLNFLDVFCDVTKYAKKIPQQQYNASGLYPIIDQGSTYIAGYSDSSEGLFNMGDAIVFGDHTRILKFVDVPFFIGADGVKVLRPINLNDNVKYLYYALKSLKIESLGYSRHFKLLKESFICYTERKQQDIVTQKLDKIIEIIQYKKKQLDLLEKLASSRFVEMFGDPVMNPHGWRNSSLLDFGECKNGMNFGSNESGISINCLGVSDFQNHSVIRNTEKLPQIHLNTPPRADYLLQDEDIVFVRSNGNKALVGRCVAVYPGNNPTVFSGFCIRFRQQKKVAKTSYLLSVLKSPSVRKQMAGRGANIQNLNQQILASVKIPIPPMELQDEFVSFIEQLDKSKVVGKMQQISLEKIAHSDILSWRLSVL